MIKAAITLDFEGVKKAAKGFTEVFRDFGKNQPKHTTTPIMRGWKKVKNNKKMIMIQKENKKHKKFQRRYSNAKDKLIRRQL